MTSKPPTIVDLDWRGDQRFTVRAARTEITIDGAGRAGPTPVQTTKYEV